MSAAESDDWCPFCDDGHDARYYVDDLNAPRDWHGPRYCPFCGREKEFP